MDLKKMVKTELTFESEISLSDKIEDPTVVDPSNSIKLIFSEDLDMETVSDGIKLFKVGSNEEEVDDVKIISQENAPNILYLNKPAILGESEEYKLSINTLLKSLNGASLKEEFITYFAIDYSFNLNREGISDLNNERSLIMVISDLHLGANDDYAELNQNRDMLVNFLKEVRYSPNIKELVIAGDLVDEWFVPMHLDTFNGKTQRDFVKAVAVNNKSVFEAFNDIIKDGNVKVTYIPGNHDILIDSGDIQSILPGISEARDVKGLGAYVPDDLPELIIEHGHRYNFFCAPDFSNRKITDAESILPPGYFFTRMATSSVMEGRSAKNDDLPVVRKNELGAEQFGYFLYWNIWMELINEFPVSAGLEEKVINTGLDGLTEFYSINDFLPYQDPETCYIDVNLHKGIIESWDERQDNNLVPIKIPREEAILKAALSSHLDEQSGIQFFDNPDSDKKIVIFGHTHDARVITTINEKGKHVYVNSGTWIDKNKCTMTFVVVAPPKDEDTNLTFVNLYQYSSKGNIKKLKSETIPKTK